MPPLRGKVAYSSNHQLRVEIQPCLIICHGHMEVLAELGKQQRLGKRGHPWQGSLDHITHFPSLMESLSSSFPTMFLFSLSVFLSFCLSVSMCRSDCRVKLWTYVPGLTPCLPRRVLAIKGRATSLP